jgi:hypothetical protein
MDSPQETIKKIVEEYGAEIYCHKNRLLGLLSDYMEANVKAKKILSNAVKENIPQKLYDIKDMSKNDRDISIVKIKVFLKDENGLEESTANFSVDCFAYALGWNTKETGIAENTSTARKQTSPQVIRNKTNKEVTRNNKVIDISASVLTKGDIDKYIKENNIKLPFTLVVPDGCTKIDDKAFMTCKFLRSIVIPNSVETIGEQAFWNCKALEKINIPPSVKRIGSYAFWNCKALTNVTIPDGIRIIEKGTFHSCSQLKKITFSNSITEIGECAFQDCGWLTEVILPSSVKKINEGAFVGCSSMTLTIPNSVKTIGEKAFGDNSNPKIICNKGSYCEKYCLLNGIWKWRLTVK